MSSSIFHLIKVPMFNLIDSTQSVLSSPYHSPNIWLLNSTATLNIHLLAFKVLICVTLYKKMDSTKAWAWVYIASCDDAPSPFLLPFPPLPHLLLPKEPPSICLQNLDSAEEIKHEVFLWVFSMPNTGRTSYQEFSQQWMILKSEWHSSTLPSNPTCWGIG